MTIANQWGAVNFKESSKETTVVGGSSSKYRWINNRTKRARIKYMDDINMLRNVHRLNSKFDIDYRDIRKFKET